MIRVHETHVTDNGQWCWNETAFNLDDMAQFDRYLAALKVGRYTYGDYTVGAERYVTLDSSDRKNAEVYINASHDRAHVDCPYCARSFDASAGNASTRTDVQS